MQAFIRLLMIHMPYVGRERGHQAAIRDKCLVIV